MRWLNGLSRREWLATCFSPVLCARQASDVSAKFEAARGVRVTQITDSALGNQLSYYDIPCYAPRIGRIVYNTVVSAGAKKANKGGAIWGVVSCRAGWLGCAATRNASSANDVHDSHRHEPRRQARDLRPAQRRRRERLGSPRPVARRRN